MHYADLDLVYTFLGDQSDILIDDSAAGDHTISNLRHTINEDKTRLAQLIMRNK